MGWYLFCNWACNCEPWTRRPWILWYLSSLSFSLKWNKSLYYIWDTHILLNYRYLVLWIKQTTPTVQILNYLTNFNKSHCFWQNNDKYSKQSCKTNYKWSQNLKFRNWLLSQVSKVHISEDTLAQNIFIPNFDVFIFIKAAI